MERPLRQARQTVLHAACQMAKHMADLTRKIAVVLGRTGGIGVSGGWGPFWEKHHTLPCWQELLRNRAGKFTRQVGASPAWRTPTSRPCPGPTP